MITQPEKYNNKDKNNFCSNNKKFVYVVSPSRLYRRKTKYKFVATALNLLPTETVYMF